MMSIQFFILYLVTKCMNEAYANIYLVDTIDGKLNDTGVGVEKNDKGEDYRFRGRHSQGRGSPGVPGLRGRGHKGRPGGTGRLGWSGVKGWPGRGHKGRPGGASIPALSGVKGWPGRGHKGRPGGANIPALSGVKGWPGRGHKGRPGGASIPALSGVKGRGIGLNPIENGINGLTPVVGVPAGSGGPGDTSNPRNIPGSGSGAVADGGSGGGSGRGITNAPITASVPPTTTVPSNEGSGCGSQNAVKNVESLSPVERTNLLEAMRKLKDSPAWGSVASIHGGAPEYTICDDGVTKEHGGFACCLHEGNSFLTWHRLYLDRMNRDLRKHDQTAVIPYWDWTVTPFPSITESSQSSFFSGPVTVPTTRRPETITSRNVNNAILSNSIGLRQRVLEILTEQRYQDFQNQLEGIHNEIHVAVGQHMADLDLASFDPIFYLHHTFIDYIWAIWQVLRPNERPQPAELSRTMNPFGKIAREALECKNYNIDENSNSILFGGLTFSQIKCEACAPDQSDCDSICGSDYSDTYAPEITTTIYNSKIYSVPKKKKKKRNKIYAGFFTRDFGISGYIKFNICKRESSGKDNCTIPGGEFSIFGGSKERKYNSTFPTKIDVTDAVINAGMNETEMCRFEITSFIDCDGNDLGKQLTRWFQPVTIFRPKDSQNDVYSFTFKGKGTQAPNVDIPKECTFQIESDGNIVDEDQKCIPVSNGYIIESKSYIQWQDENHEKYNKWNKPGKHTFNDIRFEAENEGSTITIIKY